MDINEIVAGIGSSDALKGIAAKAGISPENAQGALQGILEHVTNNGAASGMVEAIAGKVGISPEQVQQMLPHVMPLLQGHAENAEEGVQGVLGGLMSSVGGMLGGAGAQSEGPASGLMGLAKGLFGKKD
ncbi:MAG: hypothetical protein ABI376_10670 [Caulobacteraceae bacterium]